MILSENAESKIFQYIAQFFMEKKASNEVDPEKENEFIFLLEIIQKFDLFIN